MTILRIEISCRYCGHKQMVDIKKALMKGFYLCGVCMKANTIKKAKNHG